uniref:Col_cuticle_N domain-containing protein n=1 Tax=Heterorhabditis bacteriophora TaxID=37862 RepID=A0A1I7WBK6_HETBA
MAIEFDPQQQHSTDGRRDDECCGIRDSAGCPFSAGIAVIVVATFATLQLAVNTDGITSSIISKPHNIVKMNDRNVEANTTNAIKRSVEYHSLSIFTTYY